jgi:hypothetical protein
MDAAASSGLSRYFQDVAYQRQPYLVGHPLTNSLAIAILAAGCGAVDSDLIASQRCWWRAEVSPKAPGGKQWDFIGNPTHRTAPAHTPSNKTDTLPKYCSYRQLLWMEQIRRHFFHSIFVWNTRGNVLD